MGVRGKSTPRQDSARRGPGAERPARAAALAVQATLQTSEDNRTLQELRQATNSALAAGDLVAARTHITNIEKHPLARQGQSDAEDAWQREYERQLLAAAQINPITQSYGHYLADLRDRIASNIPKEARSTPTKALFALIRWRQSKAAVAAPLADLQQSMPRVHALLKVPATKAAVTTAAKQLSAEPSSDDDHLLTAIAMRIAQLPEVLVEAELRRTDTSSRSAGTSRALAICLEAQGRRREAYQASLQLVDHPVVGAIARWAVARLAASMGETSRAQRHVQDALATPSRTPLWRPVVLCAPLGDSMDLC